ncbi:zeta toxin family protein [Stenotrophomonas maltophilia]|uniref:zeta toxin family protein n=1 Tax=Stenotrophomonas maltophilia TaxID=40324 RepID=UPI0021C98C6F|nr:zeta toxin family protein [Stenotrophomonas maltophilia]MCU1142243.1 zeta toxin family protein [Stenotrophomonas maltophilia]
MQELTKEARAELIDTAYYSLSGLTEAATKPSLTIVLGQAGTPTALVQREVEALRRPEGGAVLVSGYDMDRLAAGEGFEADQVDSQALTIELVERAMAEHVNVVVTPSPTTEEMPLALIAAARRNGYEVEIAALAVNPRAAAAQSFQRSAIGGAGFSQLSDSVLTAEAANVGKALRRIEANGIPAKITLYDRAARPLERDPSQTASEAFEMARGVMRGADKIRIAAAWEEVVEAHERAGASLPENGERLRQQAHYVLRQSGPAAMNFDDKFPEHMTTSKNLAERYGRTLARHFEADDRAAVSAYPELTRAFIAKSVAERVGNDMKMPEMIAEANERIRGALLTGGKIAAIEVQSGERESAKQYAFDLER